MDKNVGIGAGLIALGLFLAYRAKQQGKHVPLIGNFLPSPKAV